MDTACECNNDVFVEDSFLYAFAVEFFSKLIASMSAGEFVRIRVTALVSNVLDKILSVLGVL